MVVAGVACPQIHRRTVAAVRESNHIMSVQRFCKSLIAMILAVALSPVFMTSVYAGKLEKDLDLFLEWFPGEYDNYEQAWQDNLDKVEQPHEHIHHIFLKVDAPAIGDNVFFVQQYMDGDPSNVYRHRLYRLDTDKKQKAVRLTIFSYKDEAKYLNGHLKPAIFESLTQDELIERPGCEVYWQFDKKVGYFNGYMIDKACSFISQRSGQKIYITDTLRLTENEIWIRDEAFDEQGNRIFGNKAGISHKNRKVTYYDGWAGVSSDGRPMAMVAENWSETDSGFEFTGELDVFGRFKIHNEGQIVPIPLKSGEPSGYSVQMAKLTYQNTAVPILTLKLIEDSTGKTLAYSWGDLESGKIGLNTRWMQMGMTRTESVPSYGFGNQDE